MNAAKAPLFAADDVSGPSSLDAELHLPDLTAQAEVESDELDWPPQPIRYLFEVPMEGGTRKLSAPVKVRIERSGDFISATAVTLSLVGIAQSVDAALEELAKSIAEVWKELSALSPRQMEPSALAQALRLKALLAR